MGKLGYRIVQDNITFFKKICSVVTVVNEMCILWPTHDFVFSSFLFSDPPCEKCSKQVGSVPPPPPLPYWPDSPCVNYL